MSSTAALSALALIDKIKVALETQDLSNNPEARSTVLDEIAKLRSAVETPSETVRRLCAQPMQNAALRAAASIGVLNMWSSFSLLDENEEIDVARLAKNTQCDPALVVRVMRVLTAMGVGTEVGPGRYTSNALSKAFTQPGSTEGVRFLFDASIPSLANLIPFLESTQYRNPTTSSPFERAYNSPFFTYLQSHPTLAFYYQTFMSGRRPNLSSWLSTYPFHQNVIANSRPAPDPFFIDIGGSHGHDLYALSDTFPTLPGPLLLLDNSSALSDLPLGRHPFIAVHHDFFTPLPPSCQRARVYHLRAILHDYPTEASGAILKIIVEAMEVGYSRLIVREYVMRDEGWSLEAACNDLLMLTLHGGMERTEQMWRDLLETAELKITGMWGVGGEGIIEAVKVGNGEEEGKDGPSSRDN